MNQFLYGVARAVSEAFDLPGPIVEIGSYQVEGQESVGDLRGLFPGHEYTGIDMRLGPGVDLVADVEELPLDDASVGTVIALNTFEHVPRFWRGFEEIDRVLRTDGVFFVACPFYFRIHNHPSDYWRFTPEALDFLMRDAYPQRVMGWHGAVKRPASTWAIGFRPDCPPISPEQMDRYRTLLRCHAGEPVPFHKWWRYHLARWLCGRTPLAPYLDQECWDTQLLTAEVPALR